MCMNVLPCMNVCVPYTHLIPDEVRRKHQMKDLELPLGVSIPTGRFCRCEFVQHLGELLECCMLPPQWSLLSLLPRGGSPNLCMWGEYESILSP